jgi:hypothetical protein
MIAQGRARGNYLARVYDLTDPIADLACTLSINLFGGRCWNDDSLMQNTIGLDHLAASPSASTQAVGKQTFALARGSGCAQ